MAMAARLFVFAILAFVAADGTPNKSGPSVKAPADIPKDTPNKSGPPATAPAGAPKNAPSKAGPPANAPADAPKDTPKKAGPPATAPADTPKDTPKNAGPAPATTPATTRKFLNPNDAVAISFWIISIAMVAATVFFLMEAMSVGAHWKTSMHVGALVTLVAAVHYFYMREYWVTFESSPILYRYIDWSITVPLQMIEFYLILKAVKPDIGAGMFYRLFFGTVVMLVGGYCGEAGFVSKILGFVVGMGGWGYILFEIFAGEAGQISGTVGTHVQTSFSIMRLIVTVGWAIYPAGYFFGYLIFAGNHDNILNAIYNLADFVNKIAFCLAIWSSAKADTLERIEPATYTAAPFVKAPVAYEAPTYAAPTTRVAPVSYAASTTYASAPVTTYAAPMTAQAAPTTYAAPVTYATLAGSATSLTPRSQR